MRQITHPPAATQPRLPAPAGPAVRCLDCKDEIWLEPEVRFEGAMVCCPHCKSLALVARELNDISGRLDWSLINPDADEQIEEE